MEKLDIRTSHNIVVTVELANTSQRILAYCIDGFVIMISLSIISLIFSSMPSLISIIILPIILFYHLLMEYFNEGRSLGKMALKLKVVSLDGERPELMDLVMRWMFRLIDVTGTAGLLAITSIASTKKSQRVGDILANTTAVRTSNDEFISLKSLHQIADKNYKVTYPEVVKYDDSDMLLVKEVLRRNERKPTEENINMLNEMYLKIKQDLKLKSIMQDRPAFLKTLINDYVVLTR